MMDFLSPVSLPQRRGLPGFLRASPGLNSLGIPVGQNRPRFETGYFEEGYTNLISQSGSSWETDDGISRAAGTATVTRSTAWAKDGTYSADVVGAVDSSNCLMVRISAGGGMVTGLNYVGQAVVKNPNASSITVSVNIAGGGGSQAYTIPAGAEIAINTNAWASSVTSTSSTLRLFEATGQRFLADAFMVSEGRYRRPWILGGTSRSTLYGSGAITVEESVQNLMPYSDPTSLAQFGPNSGVQITSGVSDQFRGGLYYQDNAATRYGYQLITVSVGTPYTMSCVVRMDDGGAPSVTQSATSGDFSFVLGGTASFTNPVVTVSSLGGGAYKVVLVATTASAANTNSGVVKYNTQSARGFKVSGFQVEQRAYATSYHPTNGVAATRAAESYQKALTSPLPAEWTALVLFKPTWASTQDVGAASGPVIFCLFGSDFNNRIQLQYVFANDRFRAYKAVAGVAAEPFVPSTAFSADTWIWGAVRQSATTGLRLSLKIGTGAPAHASDAASTAMFSTAPTLTLGTYQGATHHANSAFDHYHIIGRYLTDAQVEAWMYADTPPTAEASTILLEKFRRPSRGLVIG